MSSTAPAMFWAALDTRISTAPRAATAEVANCSTESRVGQVEVDGDGLAPVGPDGRRGILALVDPPGPERHRVPEGGQGLGGGLADARRGAGDHGRPAFGVGLEAGHQRRVTVVGRAARPRTLIEWTRSMPSGSTS